MNETMSNFEIVRADTNKAFADAGALAAALWPHHTAQEMTEALRSCDEASNAVLVAYAGTQAIAFAHVALRRDYVQGTQTSPVGYLEGIFVQSPYRKRGVARRLIDAGMAWAKARGCSEFASDCELENEQSAQMHKALGFAETGRIVCFVRPIE